MRFGLFVFVFLFLLTQKAQASHKITEVELKGLRFTDADWLLSYLPLQCPCELSDEKILELQQKILTTQVFQNVNFSLQTTRGDDEKLTIDVQEKWTVIPVIRAAYGGGTPLVVAGIYDSHFKGRLLTLGAETRTYGNAPTGGVAWIRAPRWKEGNHYYNVELWRDNRVRSVYDEGDDEIGRLYGSAFAINSDYLVPINGKTPAIQVGVRYQFRDQQELSWSERPAVIRDETTANLEKETTHSTLLRGIYDKVLISGLNLDGLRFILSGGPVFSENRTRTVFEQEVFYYHLWPDDWNLALHQWASVTNAKTYQSLTFLGGFDSIRGIPDGALVGNKALYGNVELRKLLYKTQYAWFQSAAYVDYGSAATTADEFGQDSRTSVGVGLRLAVPQVHRLMFRLDYAWSIDRPGTGSVSAGLNQFIDPYRPL